MENIGDRRARLLGSAALFYEEPVHLVRGEGVFLYDDKGREYIDLYNNVPCVGHANPVVTDAIAKQMATLQVHSRYLHEGILDYAERLIELHHEGMETAVFTCSGTEAADVALQMARAATNGVGIIYSDATYHGNSTEVRKLSGRTNQVDQHFAPVPFPQTYRPLGGEDARGLSEIELCDLYVDQVRSAVDGFKERGIPFAGMMVCSIFANEGLPNIPEEYMRKAAAVVREAGGLLIADEVQAGFCRSGDWWGYETSGFKPDIALMGKPMGNGLPLACVVASAEVVGSFRDQTRYFNTFAASPVQAAAGMAVLDEIENRDLRVESGRVGEYLRTELKRMRIDPMGDVRGCGLFTGIDWVVDPATREPDAAGAARIANRLKDAGFLLSPAGALGNVLKIRPPLVFEKHHADRFLQTFRDVISEH